MMFEGRISIAVPDVEAICDRGIFNQTARTSFLQYPLLEHSKSVSN